MGLTWNLQQLPYESNASSGAPKGSLLRWLVDGLRGTHRLVNDDVANLNRLGNGFICIVEAMPSLHHDDIHTPVFVIMIGRSLASSRAVCSRPFIFTMAAIQPRISP